MDAQQFAYWLQGFAELNEQPPSPEQWQSIREHLATVFTKVTPPRNPVNRQYPQPWPFHAPADASQKLQPLTAECVIVKDSESRVIGMRPVQPK